MTHNIEAIDTSWQRLSLMLATVLIVVLSVGVWAYHHQSKVMHEAAIKQLDSIATAKAQQIRDWRKERLADAAVLQSDPLLSEEIRRFLSEQEEHDSTNLRTRFKALCQHYGYQQVSLISLDGRPVLSSGSDHTIHQEYSEELPAAIAERKPIFTTLHTHQTGDINPHISTVTPIYNIKENNAPLAALLLISSAHDFLFPLLNEWPVPSQTAETTLFRREGDSLVFLNIMRHSKDRVFQRRFPLGRTDSPAVQALLGAQGAITGHDYGGNKVVAFALPIPDSPWFIEAKQDHDELFAEWRMRSGLLLAFYALLTCAGTIIGLLIWQRKRRRHFELLYHSEARRRAEAKRHSVTLKAIGDAVIATDANGRVELLNPVAEIMTGWTEAEALGKPLETVFRILNEKTRETVESPTTKVQREKRIIGLSNHTLLVDRNGREHPIAYSAAPILQEQDIISGVVLIFRDQTTEQNYRMLFREMLDGFASHEIICAANGKPIDYRFLDVNPAFERMTGLKAEAVIGKTVLEVMPNTESYWIETYGRVALTGQPEHFEQYAAAIGRYFEVSAFRSASNQFVTVFQDITDRKHMEDHILQSQKIESVGRLAGGIAHDFNNILGAIMGNAEMLIDDIGTADPNHRAVDDIISATRRAAAVTRQLLGFARQQTITPKVLDPNRTVENMLSMLRRLIGENIELHWKPGTTVSPINMDPSQIDQLMVNLCINARDAIDGAGSISIETDTKVFDEAYCNYHPDAKPGTFVMLEVSDSGCGMDTETLENIFEPFFTTKAEGKGTGLGLATAYGIIRQNNGFINVYSEPEKGSTFKLYIPEYKRREMPEQINEQRSPKKKAPKGNGETILVVEDDDAILRISETMLDKLGYNVMVASSPKAALKLADQHTSNIDLLLTDVIMPGMNGHDLSIKLQADYPKLRTLYMSGHTAEIIGYREILDANLHLLQKPFSLHELATAVQRRLANA